MVASTHLDLRALSPAERFAVVTGAPGSFYMTGEDALQLSGWNVGAGNRLIVAGRFLGLDGFPRSFEHDLPLTSNRVVASVVRQFGQGCLLNLTVRLSGVTAAYGATFARAQVVRGVDGSGRVIGTLCAGYVTSEQPIAFPGGFVRSMLEGPGNIRSIAGSNPAAGVEVSETVPTGARWRLIALAAQLVTDATAANRLPRLLIDDGASVYYQSDPAAAQTAATTVNHVAGAAVQRSAVVSSTASWALPNDLRLSAGHRIRTSTASLQAGDNWDIPQLLVEEWLENL